MEDISHKIWLLLHAGHDKQALIEAVNMLGECCWSSALAEKLHTGVAAVKKFHLELRANHLLARAYVHLVRHMLAGQSSEEKAMEKWTGQWNRLQRSCPQKISGRHIFLRQVMATAASHEQRKFSGGRPFDRKRITQLHGAEWAALSQDKKQRYHQLAEEERSRLTSHRYDQMQAHLERGAVLGAQLSTADGDPGRLTSSRVHG